jgi:hypothetical protein
MADSGKLDSCPFQLHANNSLRLVELALLQTAHRQQGSGFPHHADRTFTVMLDGPIIDS